MSGIWLRRVAYLLAASVVVFAVVLASRFGGDPGLVESPLLGEDAPDFDLPTLNGETTVRLTDLSGDIVVVNFFASWCLECRLEHDDFVATADAFAADDVTFVHIAYHETPNASLNYLEEAGRSGYAIYLQDLSSRAAIAYGVFGIPETFFIDQSGVVVGKIIGETDAATLGATIDAIKRGERPGQSVTGNTAQAP